MSSRIETSLWFALYEIALPNTPVTLFHTLYFSWYPSSDIILSYVYVFFMPLSPNYKSIEARVSDTMLCIPKSTVTLFNE